MDSEEKALSLYSDFREKLVRKRTSCPKDLQKCYTFCCVWGKSVKIPVQQRVCGQALSENLRRAWISLPKGFSIPTPVGNDSPS